MGVGAVAVIGPDRPTLLPVDNQPPYPLPSPHKSPYPEVQKLHLPFMSFQLPFVKYLFKAAR
jgi:hypothetical protein